MSVAAASLAAGTPKSAHHDLLDETLDLTEPTAGASLTAPRLRTGSR